MFSKSTFFSRANFKKYKISAVMFIPIGFIIFIWALIFMDDRSLASRDLNLILTVLSLFAGLMLIFFGIFALCTLPKIKNYMDCCGLNSCTYGEYLKWAADQNPNAKTFNNNTAKPGAYSNTYSNKYSNTYSNKSANTSSNTSSNKSANTSANTSSNTSSNTSGASSSTQARKIVFCTNCGAKMRVPDNGKRLNVTCPFCKGQFIV